MSYASTNSLRSIHSALTGLISLGAGPSHAPYTLSKYEVILSDCLRNISEAKQQHEWRVSNGFASDSFDFDSVSDLASSLIERMPAKFDAMTRTDFCEWLITETRSMRGRLFTAIYC